MEGCYGAAERRRDPLETPLLLFFILSGAGWLWEVVFVGLSTGTLVNRGFLHGPWLPVYGVGGLLFLLLGLHRLAGQPQRPGVSGQRRRLRTGRVAPDRLGGTPAAAGTGGAAAPLATRLLPGAVPAVRRRRGAVPAAAQQRGGDILPCVTSISYSREKVYRRGKNPRKGRGRENGRPASCPHLSLNRLLC